MVLLSLESAFAFYLKICCSSEKALISWKYGSFHSLQRERDHTIWPIKKHFVHYCEWFLLEVLKKTHLVGQSWRCRGWAEEDMTYGSLMIYQ